MFFYKPPYQRSDADINNWPYWYFEEYIKMVNTPDPDKTITIAP
jgi:hypothetical protein